MAAALTQQQIRALVDSVYAVSGHSHVIADTAGLQAGLDAKFNASGGIVTGAILTPDGSAAAPAIAFSGQSGSGMWRDANGLQFSHAGVSCIRGPQQRHLLSPKRSGRNGQCPNTRCVQSAVREGPRDALPRDTRHGQWILVRRWQWQPGQLGCLRSWINNAGIQFGRCRTSHIHQHWIVAPDRCVPATGLHRWNNAQRGGQRRRTNHGQQHTGPIGWNELALRHGQLNRRLSGNLINGNRTLRSTDPDAWWANIRPHSHVDYR